jgi:hypothetical protein
MVTGLKNQLQVPPATELVLSVAGDVETRRMSNSTAATTFFTVPGHRLQLQNAGTHPRSETPKPGHQDGVPSMQH